MILITGGAGYIGSHVNKLLSLKGYETLVLDNLIYGHKEFAKWGTFLNGDLKDVEGLRELFESYPIKAVMHFAGFTYVEESVKDPERYYINNVSNTLNLLQAMLEFNVKYFIFSSSSAVYGNPIEIPISEGHPLNPMNPYGKSKLMVENILKDYSGAYGLMYASLRYFNAGGADPEGDIGEWHEPETHLIPLVLDAAMGVREDIRIFGTDYNTPDGTCVRDYIHVVDLAQAHRISLEYLLKEGQSRIFNLGNGNGFSVKQVIEEARRITGRDIKAVENARRAGDPPVLIADPKRAMKVLGWKPEYNDLTTILETAWKWHKGLRGEKEFH
ncbi:MAG: UDP-glucose 4-epimerase GalE [Nitrospirae bacterium]|nr:UDP-glucose 4-epimerase GalE [Nitrospirota bacterium]